MSRVQTARFVSLVSLFAALPLSAQWTNRYPKLDGYNHHVYLEGYELPTMNAGPTDPAPHPDGRRVAFSARGWLWLLDPATGIAQRLTDGPHMDFRPAWAPDGRALAFVRDDTRDTWIESMNVETRESAQVNTPALDLDPAFGPDGRLYYSSAVEGQLDLWSRRPGADSAVRLTTLRGIELKPSVSADGRTLVYLHKGGGDRVVAHDLTTGEETALAAERIVSQTRPAVSPDGRTVVYGWATERGYELRLVSVANPSTSVRLTEGLRGLPLSPAWSPDGTWIWFTEAGADEVMRLYRVRAVGGDVEEVPVRAWSWGAPTGTIRVVTRLGDRPSPARLTVTDRAGHPAVPSDGYAQFALQHGRIFFYSPGVIEVTVLAGETQVSAVRGLTTPEVTRTVTVRAGETVEVPLSLDEVWDAHAAGYVSSDHHFHLNYGGPYHLDPEDLLPMMAGEQLDVATPQVANLHNRFEEQDDFAWTRDGTLPLIRFSQEVRSHFLGHVGLHNTSDLFWPWVWGPGYQVYGSDDRPNAEPLAFARAQGGLGGYVHPIGTPTPFDEAGRGTWPVLLAADGILGNMDYLEVACLWTDEVGTAEAWYRFLNLGVPIALEAGTDVMNNYYRTMAVGSTRLYVRTGGATNLRAYWDAMQAGRSFVTNGPVLLFTAGGMAPGDVLPRGGNTPWEITLHSAVPVDTVEVLVNGEVVWSGAGLGEPGSRTYRGTARLPAGGWIAARARGGDQVWPAMDSYTFAHSSPIWIASVGSTDRAARRRAAAELGPVLDASEARLLQGYGGAENVPRILAVFAAARARLAEAAR